VYVCGAGISVGNWRPHVLAVLLSVMHEAVKMASIYDQLSAQVDCADVSEMLGAGRKRHLLLSEVIRVLSLRDAGGNSYMLRRVCESLGTQILRKPSEMTRQQVAVLVSIPSSLCAMKCEIVMRQLWHFAANALSSYW
jgi:hypothetical protein